MERHSVETLVSALNRAGVRYLIAGGLAVVAHGYVRFTADIDLLLDLEPNNLARAIGALRQVGYRPRAPVPFDAFADPEQRAAWVRDKNLTVFSLYSDEHPLTEIDLFVEPPADFSVLHARALRKEVAPATQAMFVGLDDLLSMKRAAGRPQDLLDIAGLGSLGRETPNE